jgi:hypothetical protein
MDPFENFSMPVDPGDVLAPLSRDRIEDVMKEQDWKYQIDDDGDLGGHWDNNYFFFFLYGEEKEILQVRGRWHQSLPIERRADLRAILDEWHMNKIWPKAYTRVDDSGQLWVLAEHSVDWEFGVTNKQLSLTIRCAIMTSLSLFKELTKHFITGGQSI